MDYFGGIDHGQLNLTDINGTGVGEYSVNVWPQDDNFPAQTVWMVSENNAIAGTANQCGATPIGLARGGLNGLGSNFGVVGATIIPLPTDLISIHALGIEDHIAVSWNVASEVNVSHYELERSEDGQNFEYVSTLDARGNSLSAQLYGYNDFEVRYFKQYYYRVRAIDFNGDEELTPVVSASLTTSSNTFDENAVAIFPNPTASDFSLSIQSSEPRNVQIQLYNTIGQVIQSEDLHLQAGNTLMQYSLEDKAYGMYLLEIKDTNSNQLITKRILKQ